MGKAVDFQSIATKEPEYMIYITPDGSTSVSVQPKGPGRYMIFISCNHLDGIPVLMEKGRRDLKIRQAIDRQAPAGI